MYHIRSGWYWLSIYQCRTMSEQLAFYYFQEWWMFQVQGWGTLILACGLICCMWNYIYIVQYTPDWSIPNPGWVQKIQTGVYKTQARVAKKKGWDGVCWNCLIVCVDLVCCCAPTKTEFSWTFSREFLNRIMKTLTKHSWKWWTKFPKTVLILKGACPWSTQNEQLPLHDQRTNSIQKCNADRSTRII